MNKTKILYITSHLSTGGMPQYLLKKIQSLNNAFDIYCIEHRCVSDSYVVQRNQIENLLGNKLFTLNGKSDESILEIIKKVQPNIIHFEELPESFISKSILLKIYTADRKYCIFETSHDSSFDTNNKIVLPDKFIFVSKYQSQLAESLRIPTEVVEYPIIIRKKPTREEALRKLSLDPDKKHVVNIGLFTPRKNQKEIFDYARRLHNYPIQFHFIGNQADNFKQYWEPLMKDRPLNCICWGERRDVDLFYEAADLFLFTSRGTVTDKETSPLVIREAISFNVPSLIYNLPVYMGMYDKHSNINYLDFDSFDNNCNKIINTLGLKSKENIFTTTEGEKEFAPIENKIPISPNTTFVDLCAGIGRYSRYAVVNGAKEVFSFEPNLATLLKINVPEAKVYPLLVGCKNEIVDIDDTHKSVAITMKDVLTLVNKPIDCLRIDLNKISEKVLNTINSAEWANVKKVYLTCASSDQHEKAMQILENIGFSIKNDNMVYAELNFVSCISASYDNTDNKINFSTSRLLRDVLVTVKELDSRVTMWSAYYDPFNPHINYWIVPVPKQYQDMETNPHVGGLLVEFRQGDKLIFSKEIRIKPTNCHVLVPKIKNNISPAFNNYVEFFVEKIYKNILEGKSFDTVVDVGANIGMWIEYVRSFAKTKKIYAIEPNVQALKVMHDSFSDDEVTIIDKALYKENGELEFFVDPSNSTISSVAKYGALKEHYKVSAISFKTFLTQYGISYIDLMKVDIETGEYDLFASLDGSDFNKIGTLIVEYHLFNDRSYDRDVKNLLNIFETNKFKTEIFSAHASGGFIFATRIS